MWRKFGVIIVGTLCLAVALASAGPRDDKGENTGIKGGIDGKIKTVDVANKTLTIITAAGKQSTFEITEDTTLLGPRGGKVRRHLKDPRFHEGFPVTIVAKGNAATEVHLGYARDEGASGEHVKTAKKVAQNTSKFDDQSANKSTDVSSSKTRISKAAPDDDEGNEFPGKVKSFDSNRRILVVELLNGSSRSFLLANDVKVVVKGAASQKGLHDSALKTGAHITVITDEGGHKVKELEIGSGAKLKKAG
jgi:hypothetical protein